MAHLVTVLSDKQINLHLVYPNHQPSRLPYLHHKVHLTNQWLPLHFQRRLPTLNSHHGAPSRHYFRQ